MSKEQMDFWPKDAEKARADAKTDWRPDDDATRSEGEPTYRTRRKRMKRFLHNATRGFIEKAKR